jgi:lipopolysaccharide export system protein LptA
MNRLRAPLLLLAVLTGPAAVRAAEPKVAASAPLLQRTEISSDQLDMVSSPTETMFTFREKVIVTATNLQLTCDQMVVVARRTGDPAATIGKPENFKSLIATGHVRLVQGDRVSTCGRAEIFPGEDKVVLTENVRVAIQNEDYVATGPRIELYRGQRRAVILSDRKARPTITLPGLKDLGYEKQPEKKKAPAGATGEKPPGSSP